MRLPRLDCSVDRNRSTTHAQRRGQRSESDERLQDGPLARRMLAMTDRDRAETIQFVHGRRAPMIAVSAALRV
jgi:hypothetical protein